MTIDRSKPEVFDESEAMLTPLTDEPHEWVPFAEVVQAYYAAVGDSHSSSMGLAVSRAVAEKLEAKARSEHQARRDRFEVLKRQFESGNGNIQDSYFSRREPWGVVLTRQRRRQGDPELDIHRTGPETNDATIHIVDLLLMCDQLAEQTRSNLGPRESDRFVPVVFGIAKQLMSLADYVWEVSLREPGQKTGASPDEGEGAGSSDKGSVASAKENSAIGTPVALAVLQARLGQVREAYEDRLQRHLRVTYLLGMMMSVGVIAWLGILPGLMFSSLTRGGPPTLGPTPLERTDLALGAACFVSGSLGAFISVLIRMTSGKFRLPLMIGSREVRYLGLLRPFIGAIFGLAFYVLVVGGLIPIQVPSDPIATLFFYPGLAFLAGFSERLAQDALGRAGDQLTAAADGARLVSTRTEESEQP